MIFLWIGSAIAATGCPPVADGVEAATRALIDGLDPAAGLLAAEASLACETLDAEGMASLWLVNGAARHLAGEAEAASLFFAAAAVARPNWFDERLGPDIRKAWESARYGNPGALVVNRPVKVDGTLVRRFPATLDGGPHALQAVDTRWGKVVLVMPGEELRVEVPPATQPAALQTQAPLPAWLITSGLLLLGAGGCAYGAYAQNGLMTEAAGTADLDAAWARQQGFFGATLGLGALAATGLTLHFVLP